MHQGSGIEWNFKCLVSVDGSICCTKFKMQKPIHDITRRKCTQQDAKHNLTFLA